MGHAHENTQRSRLRVHARARLLLLVLVVPLLTATALGLVVLLAGGRQPADSRLHGRAGAAGRRHASSRSTAALRRKCRRSRGPGPSLCQQASVRLTGGAGTGTPARRSTSRSARAPTVPSFTGRQDRGRTGRRREGDAGLRTAAGGTSPITSAAARWPGARRPLRRRRGDPRPVAGAVRPGRAGHHLRRPRPVHPAGHPSGQEPGGRGGGRVGGDHVRRPVPDTRDQRPHDDGRFGTVGALFVTGVLAWIFVADASDRYGDRGVGALAASLSGASLRGLLLGGIVTRPPGCSTT